MEPLPNGPMAGNLGVQSKFTAVVKGLRTAYSTDAIKDISTSYCFICLLHLANENGLGLSSEEGLQELLISKPT